MPRKTIQRYLPSATQIRDSRVLSWIGGTNEDGAGAAGASEQKWIANPQLWHLNRRSVSGAVAVGLFVAWLPVPLQMVLAAFLASVLHVHLLISVLMVWVSNPLTFPALLYVAYRVGALLVGVEPATTGFEASWAWLSSTFQHSWQPLLAGCLFMGALSGVVGFFFTRILWRIQLVKRWQERRVRLAMRKNRT
ncbi:MAG: DUF2062 domain-containing protein [Gammaproteobacteria bacterium]|nr:DUF2062 domain-containing protein [Gammaproteobacteria bacterium]